LAGRDTDALRRARKQLGRECLFYSYMQWLADTQWHHARRMAAPLGVFGDMSFMVGSDSADVWAYQRSFRLDASVGAPPDSFSTTGQDWKLPAYRTFVIPADGGPRTFSPAEERDQMLQGERIMRVFLDSGARIIAEDLGTVPDFVRASPLRLGIAGYKVFRWEREWDMAGQPFRNPECYPNASVATSGTHDTETLVEWWEEASVEERTLVAEIPFLASRRLNATSTRCDAAARDSLLEVLAASSSDLLILPMQDVFGWRDRINVPGTMSDDNWTWRLPWPVDLLRHQPQARIRAETVLRWMRKYDRM
jgi:4-alpha-glucanotransferase